MLDYPAARAVAAVVQTGSFEAAARQLNVTPSAVSQRVKQLEERLGMVLIERGAPCVATEKGEWLCRHIEHVGMLEKELIEQLPGLVDHSSQPVTLNIATNADSLGTWFLKAAAKFTQASDYLLSIAIDDQDHTADWLLRGRVLAAVTSLKKPVPGCHVTPLGTLRYLATASPEYVSRHFAKGVTRERIARAPALTFNQKDRLQHEWVERSLGRSITFPTHWVPSTQTFIDACLLGMAWGMNPTLLVEEHLASGRMVELIPGTHLDVPLYWQVNRLAADRLADLTRNVVTAAKRALVLGTTTSKGSRSS